MGTNCAPLLADLFLYSYEAEFIQSLLRSDKKTIAKSFNFTYRYIDDVLSLNNPKIGDYLEGIYQAELEVKDTTESINSASYLDLQLEYDIQGKLNLKLYDKRDDFNFPIVNFPFLSSNIPASPAYDVYASQLIRYARASSEYRSFLHRDIASQGLSKQLKNSMVVIMKLWTSLMFLCPKRFWTFLRPNSFKFGFPLPIL